MIQLFKFILTVILHISEFPCFQCLVAVLISYLQVSVFFYLHKEWCSTYQLNCQCSVVDYLWTLQLSGVTQREFPFRFSSSNFRLIEEKLFAFFRNNFKVFPVFLWRAQLVHFVKVFYVMKAWKLDSIGKMNTDVKSCVEQTKENLQGPRTSSKFTIGALQVWSRKINQELLSWYHQL